jgi:hypothetical protein
MRLGCVFRPQMRTLYQLQVIDARMYTKLGINWQGKTKRWGRDLPQSHFAYHSFYIDFPEDESEPLRS